MRSWASFERTPSYCAWRGNAFEIACVNHEREIKRAIGIEAVETECFPWSSSNSSPGAQVDLVIERRDRVTNLCEAKYTDDAYVINAEHERELRRKARVFQAESRTTNAIQLTLISAHGLSSNTHSWDVASVVTADDLFR